MILDVSPPTQTERAIKVIAQFKQRKDRLAQSIEALEAYATNNSTLLQVNSGGGWVDYYPNSASNIQDHRWYRLKPAPRCREYTDKELIDIVGEEVRCDGRCGYTVTGVTIESAKTVITITRPNGTWFYLSPQGLFNGYTKADGSRLGVLTNE